MKTTNIRKVLGHNVKYYRFNNNYTQEQLAEKCCLSPRYISDIENGKGNVSVDTVSLLAKALKLDYYMLFCEKETGNLKKRVNMR